MLHKLNYVTPCRTKDFFRGEFEKDLATYGKVSDADQSLRDFQRWKKENSVLCYEISIILPTKGFLFEHSTPHFLLFWFKLCFHFLLAFLNNRFGSIHTMQNKSLQKAVLYQNMALYSLGS